MGRDGVDVDWELFEKTVWVPVITNAQLADILGVGETTLERHVKAKFGCTIDALRAQKQGPMKKALFASMWKLAMEGNVTSQIWLSKNLFGWKDKADISISGPKPLIIERSDGKEIILTARNQIEEKAS